LALAGPKDRLDPLAHGAERAEARLLVLAVGPQEGSAALGHEGLEVAAGEALIGRRSMLGEPGEACCREARSLRARVSPAGDLAARELVDTGPDDDAMLFSKPTLLDHSDPQSARILTCN